jgi:AraC family transcriptional activator of mtrCDE
MPVSISVLITGSAMSEKIDRVVEWLLEGLEFETTVFHVGQYCGSWQASTSGRGLGSFHLILKGQCYLHMPNRQPILLNPRDSVFLLHDIPHFLSPSSTIQADTSLSEMRPLQQNLDGSTGLVCGFFNFHGAVSKLMLDSFPPFLIVRAEDMRLRAASALFDLLLDEPALDSNQPSPLTGRLTELLFFYVIRLVAKDQDIGSGLLAVVQRQEFSQLVENVMTDPGRDWTVDRTGGFPV